MEKKFLLFALLLPLSFYSAVAQTISGQLPALANETIRLEGFEGFDTYPIATTQIDEKGNFSLNYSVKEGVAYLISADQKPYFLILSGEDVVIQGDALSSLESIKVLKGQENQWLDQYASEHPRREQALSAWIYLEKIYQLDSLFAVQEIPQKAIVEEKTRIRREDSLFLAQLPKDAYVSWFLPTRKLISSVSVVAQYRTGEIQATIAAFRQLDYSNPRFYRSGLLKDALESHFWLIENSGVSLELVYKSMKVSIDSLMNQLSGHELLMNEITNFLFNLLETHSLFEASEYLALKALSQNSCTLNDDLARQLETYRAMKKGKIAPDFVFVGDVFAPAYEGDKIPEKLSDISDSYVLVAFGASWCPACKSELNEMAQYYRKWKTEGLEVVFVSLDENRSDFESFASDFGFISVCDYQKWNSPVVQSYYVFGTPTLFLLDQNRKILLRPISVKQMDAWVDWFLIQGNPMKD